MTGRLMLALAAALAATSIPGAAIAAGETPPLGPGFGNSTIEGEIRNEDGPDLDDFVAPVVAGERLTVVISAAKGSALRPSLRLLDPEGVDRTPDLRVVPKGTSLRVISEALPLSGWWTVRVGGDGESEGAYRARLLLWRPQGTWMKHRLSPGEAPRMESLPLEAVDGSALHLKVDAGGPLPTGLAVLDPAGAPHPLLSSFLVQRGRLWCIEGLPLDGASGAWTLRLGVEDRSVRVSGRVIPPERHRGLRVLDLVEPRLHAEGPPLEAASRGLLRLTGSGFSAVPLPRVLVGGIPAEVREVGPARDRIDVLLPLLPLGTALDAAVINPDGQASVARGRVIVRAPGDPVVSRFLQESLVVPAGGTASVTLLLSGHAPAGGASVALEATEGIGSVPGTAAVEPWALEATFLFTAGDAPGAGYLRATLGGTLVLPVTVTEPPPPDSLDLAGWKLVQTSAAKTFVLPEGTVVPRDGALIVARKSSRAEFEAFWGEALPEGVHFLDTADRFPSLNGDETLAIVDPDGLTVDGPTTALTVGRFYRRIPGTDAGLPGSWIDGVASPAAVTPGGPTPAAAGSAGIYIAQYADPSATGQFVHEFLEIRWDGTGR